MATAALTSTPTILNNGDSTTGWNGDTFSTEPDIKVQGTNSISCVQTDNGANDIYVTGFTGFSINTTDVHFRLWFNITFIGNLAASNPIQVWCTDGTNTAYWTWTGGSNYSGGWAQAIIYTGLTPTSGTKPTGTITQVGIRFNTASKPRNVPANSWFDYWTYGNGYTVTGGTSGDPITWDDIAAADTDVTNTAYNIVTKVGGVIFVRGDIQIGDGTSTTYFDSTGRIVVFPNEQVSSSLYSISFIDSASNLTNINISGGAWASQSTSYRFTFDASDSNINSYVQNGTQFSNAGLISYAAGGSIKNCVYSNCLQIDPSTATFKYNSISNSVDTGGAVLFPSDDSNISDLTFTNNDYGVEYDSSSDNTSPAFVNFVFDDVSGNYDVNNTSGASATIALSGTSNANSHAGSLVTFQSSSTLKLTVKDENGNVVGGAYAYIDDNNSSPYIMNTTTNVITGIASTAWTGGSVSNATWRVRKYGYKPFKVISDVPASGTKDIPVTLIEDPQQT